MGHMKIACFIVLMLVFFHGLVLGADITGNVAARGAKDSKDVLVYIEKVEGSFALPEENPKITQINLVFIPHVLPVLTGTTVEFHNEDTVVHNIFGVGDDEFDLGSWKGSEVRTYTFNKPGEVAILCNVHPEMEAYVVILQNPYHSLTDENGTYNIKNVPAGSYNLKTWHDRLRPVSRKIDLPSAGVLTLDLEIKR